MSESTEIVRAEPAEITKPVGAAGHLTPEQKYAIRAAYLERGGAESYTDLGRRCVEVVGRAVNRETVAACLKGPEYDALRAQFDKEIKASAVERLKAGILPAADAWNKAVGVAADKGDHKPAKDLLMHTGTIEPLDDDGRARGPLVLIRVQQGDTCVWVGDGQTYTREEREALKGDKILIGIDDSDVCIATAEGPQTAG